MMRKDLERATKKWLKEAATEEERRDREQSDFLSYRNGEGLFADFHSNRHLFITSLERAGIRPKMAQTLARHSDIRLTLGTYTHVDTHDQTVAIQSLPAPPRFVKRAGPEAAELQETEKERRDGKSEVVPKLVPSGAQTGAQLLASAGAQVASECTEKDRNPSHNGDLEIAASPTDKQRYATNRHRSASPRTTLHGGRTLVHPARFERATFGSVGPCTTEYRWRGRSPQVVLQTALQSSNRLRLDLLNFPYSTWIPMPYQGFRATFRAKRRLPGSASGILICSGRQNTVNSLHRHSLSI